MNEVFEPHEILAVLVRHGVRFVVVGGMSALLQGSPLPTLDLDITPQRSRENLSRLSTALDELGAGIRVDALPEGLPFGHNAESLARVTVLNLRTKYGDLDLVGAPAGELTYEVMASRQLVVTLEGVEVPLADLADVIRSKEAAGREKDKRALPLLRRLLLERERAQRGEG